MSCVRVRRESGGSEGGSSTPVPEFLDPGRAGGAEDGRQDALLYRALGRTSRHTTRDTSCSHNKSPTTKAGSLMHRM